VAGLGIARERGNDAGDEKGGIRMEMVGEAPVLRLTEPSMRSVATG